MLYQAVGVLDSSISSSSSSTKLGTSTSSSSSKPTKQPHHYKYDLFRFYENMPVESPVRDGLIVNWDMLEDLREHCLISYLRLNHNASPLNLSDFPLLFAEKPYTPASTRYRLCEMMFEQYNAPAIFFSKDAVLSCYACGKTGGLVVDIGGSGTVVTPVQDGWVEQKGVCRSLVGGRMIDAQVRRIIKQASLTPFFRLDRTVVNSIDLSDGRTIQATFKQNLGRVHPSYDAYKRLEVARDLKETLCRMSDSTLMEGDSRYCSIPLVPYELPDGTKVEVNIERYQMGELLIDPSTIDQLYNQDLETLYPQLPTSITVPGTLEGVPKIMSDAVARCDHDMQAMLLKDIVLTGGSSSIDGLQDRIRTECKQHSLIISMCT